jgi:hypothetical protein
MMIFVSYGCSKPPQCSVAIIFGLDLIKEDLITLFNCSQKLHEE